MNELMESAYEFITSGNQVRVEVGVNGNNLGTRVPTRIRTAAGTTIVIAERISCDSNG